MISRLSYIFPLLFVGCTSGVSMKSVHYDDLFNDSNSKVWLVNEFVVDNVNISSSALYEKNLLIFFGNGLVNYISMKGIGDISPKRGNYYLNSEDRNMRIEFDDAAWDMNLDYITEDSVLFVTTKNSDRQFTMQIIPLTEL